LTGNKMFFTYSIIMVPEDIVGWFWGKFHSAGEVDCAPTVNVNVWTSNHLCDWLCNQHKSKNVYVINIMCFLMGLNPTTVLLLHHCHSSNLTPSLHTLLWVGDNTRNCWETTREHTTVLLLLLLFVWEA